MSRQTPEEIEKEIEMERAELSVNLHQLQESLSLDTLVERGKDYARTHGREIGRAVVEQAKANPVPVALITAGLVWLAVGPSRSDPKVERAAPRADVAFPRPAYAPVDHTPEPASRYRTAPADAAAARLEDKRDSPDWAEDTQAPSRTRQDSRPHWVPADDVWSQPGDRK
ncbi:MAG: DUF3618 domain-containing protein [Paracoccaceae bacterium]|nr:DUF3618 domain-containing protein [Loktanella sp.]